MIENRKSSTYFRSSFAGSSLNFVLLLRTYESKFGFWRNGDLIQKFPLHESSIIHRLPENYPLPFLGNGYISTPVFGNSMYVSDLYSGQGPATTRVAIPSTVNVRIDRHPELAGSTVAYTFNAEQGETVKNRKNFLVISQLLTELWRQTWLIQLSEFPGFFETLVHTNQYWIRQRLYCHIRIPELMVMEIEARGRGNFNSQVAIPITRGGNYAAGAQQLSTDSIAFEQQFSPFPGSSPYTKIYKYFLISWVPSQCYGIALLITLCTDFSHFIAYCYWFLNKIN